jgi:hypothetical protein
MDRKIEDKGVYDLVNLHTASSAMVRIAESAINGYGEALQLVVDIS